MDKIPYLDTRVNFERVYIGYTKLDDVPEESKWWCEKDGMKYIANKLLVYENGNNYFEGPRSMLVKSNRRFKKLLDASVGSCLFQLGRFYVEAKTLINNKFAADFAWYYEDRLAIVREKYNEWLYQSV